MDRQDAIEMLRLLTLVLKTKQRYLGMPDDNYDNLWTALEMAEDALTGPTPDPDTGMVPCGCGGKASVAMWQGMYSVVCDVCSVQTAACGSEALARNDWTRAMGYEREAEP